MRSLILKQELGPNSQYFFEMLKFDFVEYCFIEVSFSQYMLLEPQLIQINLFDFLINLELLIVLSDFDAFVIK